MEAKAESIHLLGNIRNEIRAKYRKASRSKSPQVHAQKYISSIERLKASNILLRPKSPSNNSVSTMTQKSHSRQPSIVTNPPADRKPHHRKSISDVYHVRKPYLVCPSESKSPIRIDQLGAKSSRGKIPSENKYLASTAPKNKLKFQAEEEFVQSVSQLSFKHINNLRKNLNYSLRGLDTMLAFLSILSDCGLDLMENPRKITMKTIDNVKQFLSNPGKLVQTLRNIPDFIKNGQIQAKTIAKARDLAEKKTNNLLKEVKSVVQEIIKLFDILKPSNENEIEAKKIHKKEISPTINRSNSVSENQTPHYLNGNTNKARILNKYLKKDTPDKEEKVTNLLGFMQALVENTVFKDLVNDIREKDDSDQVLQDLLSKYTD